MVSRENVKAQATSNASNGTPCFDAVNFLEAVLVGFNYRNYILKHNFSQITLIINQTNKHAAIPYFGTNCKTFSKWQITKAYIINKYNIAHELELGCAAIIHKSDILNSVIFINVKIKKLNWSS